MQNKNYVFSLLTLFSHRPCLILRYCFRLRFVYSLILDNERWKQADVPTELQLLVDSLVDGKKQVIFFSTLLSQTFLKVVFTDYFQQVFTPGVRNRNSP